MKHDSYIQRKEAETMRKLHAFQLFKQDGIEIINHSFPSLKGFILTNKEKTYKQIEQELLAELAHATEKV